MSQYLSLKFPDEATALNLLFENGDKTWPKYPDIVLLGDLSEFGEPVPGFHVNIAVREAIPELDPYVIEPETPRVAFFTE